MRLNELFEVYIEDVDLIQHDTSGWNEVSL